jgi:hypothetical protein
MRRPNVETDEGVRTHTAGKQPTITNDHKHIAVHMKRPARYCVVCCLGRTGSGEGRRG